MTLVISLSTAWLRSANTVSFDIPCVKAVLFKVLVIISLTSSTSSGVIIFKSSTGLISLASDSGTTPLLALVTSTSNLLALISSICLAVSLSIDISFLTKSFGKYPSILWFNLALIHLGKDISPNLAISLLDHDLTNPGIPDPPVAMSDTTSSNIVSLKPLKSLGLILSLPTSKPLLSLVVTKFLYKFPISRPLFLSDSSLLKTSSTLVNNFESVCEKLVCDAAIDKSDFFDFIASPNPLK